MLFLYDNAIIMNKKTAISESGKSNVRKSLCFGLMVLFLLTCGRVFGIESFSTFAVKDTDKMELIKGKWKLTGRPYLYEYTGDYMRRIDGFAYYRYKVSQFPRRVYLYAVFKSKKTGKSYFCRGRWDNKYGFQYSSSRIEFKGKDLFIVYTKDDPNDVYFVAERVTENETKKK